MKQLCQSKIVSVLVAGLQVWPEPDAPGRDKHKPLGSPQIKQRIEGRSISGLKWPERRSDTAGQAAASCCPEHPEPGVAFGQETFALQVVFVLNSPQEVSSENLSSPAVKTPPRVW